jgi:hypothetical protein
VPNLDRRPKANFAKQRRAKENLILKEKQKLKMLKKKKIRKDSPHREGEFRHRRPLLLGIRAPEPSPHASL